jgi:hypothetical protein
MSKLPLKCAVVSLYSAVKQQLKCNTGKLFNCLTRVLLTVVLSTDERVFLVEYVFREGNSYTNLVQKQFVEKFTETLLPHLNAVYRDGPRMLNELKTAMTAYTRNISQADLHKMFANKIKRVQACIDARGHHFQQLL